MGKDGENLMRYFTIVSLQHYLGSWIRAQSATPTKETSNIATP